MMVHLPFKELLLPFVEWHSTILLSIPDCIFDFWYKKKSAKWSEHKITYMLQDRNSVMLATVFVWIYQQEIYEK